MLSNIKSLSEMSIAPNIRAKLAPVLVAWIIGYRVKFMPSGGLARDSQMPVYHLPSSVWSICILPWAWPGVVDSYWPLGKPHRKFSKPAPSQWLPFTKGRQQQPAGLWESLTEVMLLRQGLNLCQPLFLRIGRGPQVVGLKEQLTPEHIAEEQFQVCKWKQLGFLSFLPSV